MLIFSSSEETRETFWQVIRQLGSNAATAISVKCTTVMFKLSEHDPVDSRAPRRQANSVTRWKYLKKVQIPPFHPQEHSDFTFYSIRRCSDSTHVQADITQSRLPQSNCIVHHRGEWRMTSPTGRLRASFGLSHQGQRRAGGGGEWTLPALADMLHLSYTRAGQPQQGEGINIFLKDLGLGDMSAKIHTEVTSHM